MPRVPWSSKDEPSLIQRGIPFVKMHGLRNDFIIVDAREHGFRPSAGQILLVCDRREGVGGDELVVVERPADIQSAGTDAAFVRIYNPDGREVGACGNASRCVAWLLMRERGADAVSFRTPGGRLDCRMEGEEAVSVTMGRLRTRWDEIPLAREMDTLHLGIAAGALRDPVGMNIGNPHAVFFVDDLDRVDLPRLGPILQTDPLFPEEANIGAAQMVDDRTIKLSVWERPGVLTTACGSGACAAVGAALRRGLTRRRKVQVVMPAGNLEIEVREDYTAVMTGPVACCYAGYLPAFR